MKVTQIHLTLETELLKQARGKCIDLNISVSEYLRRLIKKDLNYPPIK